MIGGDTVDITLIEISTPRHVRSTLGENLAGIGQFSYSLKCRHYSILSGSKLFQDRPISIRYLWFTIIEIVTSCKFVLSPQNRIQLDDSVVVASGANISRSYQVQIASFILQILKLSVSTVSGQWPPILIIHWQALIESQEPRAAPSVAF